MILKLYSLYLTNIEQLKKDVKAAKKEQFINQDYHEIVFIETRRIKLKEKQLNLNDIKEPFVEIHHYKDSFELRTKIGKRSFPIFHEQFFMKRVNQYSNNDAENIIENIVGQYFVSTDNYKMLIEFLGDEIQVSKSGRAYFERYS